MEIVIELRQHRIARIKDDINSINLSLVGFPHCLRNNIQQEIGNFFRVLPNAAFLLQIIMFGLIWRKFHFEFAFMIQHIFSSSQHFPRISIHLRIELNKADSSMTSNIMIIIFSY